MESMPLGLSTNGLLTGLDLSVLKPSGYANRGEVAQVLHNLLEQAHPAHLPYLDGSCYEMVASAQPLTWVEARDAAVGRTYSDSTSAHLAAITSQEEYDAVLGLFGEGHATDCWARRLPRRGVYPANVGVAMGNR